MFKNIKFGKNKDNGEQDSEDKSGKSGDKKAQNGKADNGSPKAKDSKKKKGKQAEQGEDTVDDDSGKELSPKSDGTGLGLRKSNRDKLDLEKTTDFQVHSVSISKEDSFFFVWFGFLLLLFRCLDLDCPEHFLHFCVCFYCFLHIQNQ